MSTAKVTFDQLPEAGEVKAGDFFVIQDVTTAKKINFSNIIFGLENVTFAATLSAQTTEIGFLSSSIDSLSAQTVEDYSSLITLIATTVTTATASFIDNIYPVGAVLFSNNSSNPQTYILGTYWQPVAQGQFIASVGTGVDKNGTGFTVAEGAAATNFNAGEYSHTLTVNELAAHTHTFQPIEGGNTSVAGPYSESAAGPSGAPLASITSGSTGGGVAHNNIPPLYGLYVWRRIG